MTEIKFTVNEWKTAEVEARLQAAARAALFDASHYVLEKANETVPIREGILQASGYADSDERMATISYDTPYARRQHEEMSYRHPQGRRAKWLELTLREQATQVLNIMAKRLMSALR